jgi:hypothetical protein
MRTKVIITMIATAIALWVGLTAPDVSPVAPPAPSAVLPALAP